MEYEQRLSEQQARKQTDQKLFQSDWVKQDKKQLNLFESLRVAIIEMDTSTGPADYMLFVDGKVCSIIEATKA